MTTQSEMMSVPLVDLAATVLATGEPMSVRHKAWNALNARLPELNGMEWARLSQSEMFRVNEALSQDFSGEVFQSTSQAH